MSTPFESKTRKYERAYDASEDSYNDATAEEAYWGRFFATAPESEQRRVCTGAKCGRSASGDILGGGLCDQCSSRGFLEGF